jgi:hypothetical protein
MHTEKNKHLEGLIHQYFEGLLDADVKQKFSCPKSNPFLSKRRRQVENHFFFVATANGAVESNSRDK